jgi:excisionase family DNA binding protein
LSSKEFSAMSFDNAARTAASGVDGRHDGYLLTVREVADLLQVPVSWVYGRMRKRSPDRLPGYRLGKYWRFNEAEVIAWLARQRANA